ncbi:MAG: ECF-type sigma factor [Tahibacter sp.]
MNEPDASITVLLQRWRAGDKAAETQLIDLLYPTLKQIAQRALGTPGHQLSLCATELAHEAYVRLAGQQSLFVDRQHFLAVCARVTRNVLIDLMRERKSEKRGGQVERISLDDGLEVADEASRIDWYALEQGLQRLETRDANAAQVVELRYFGGLSNEEVAGLLDVGVATVQRRWAFARAWLHHRL